MQPRKLLLLCLVCAFFTGSLFFSKKIRWSSGESDITSPSVLPTIGNVREVISSKGNVSYQHQAIIKATSQGVVNKIYVREGQLIKGGQALIQINDPDAVSDLATRDKDQVKLGAKIDAINRDLADLNRLVSAGASPRSELEQKRLELTLTQTDLEVARLDKEKLERAQFRALAHSPFDGTILQMHLGLGQWVNTGEDIAVVAGGSSRQIVAYIDATELPRLKLGQAVDFSNQPDGAAFRRGHITTIGDVVDSAQRANSVRVAITPDSDISDLRVSQQLYLEIVIQEASKVLRIPRGYIRQEQDRNLVYVDEADGIKARPVTLGAEDRYFNQVKSGLQISDRIVRPPEPGIAGK
jgi:RND family efflux transporter MFP subunit